MSRAIAKSSVAFNAWEDIMPVEMSNRNRWRRGAARTIVASSVLGALLSSGAASAEEASSKRAKTVTPIKHLIVVIGENRTFDNVYGTYVPRRGQKVWNLLSRGIVNANGAPGPNRDAARQFQLGTINPVSYFISTNKLIGPNKTAYSFLPTPEAGGAPPQTETLSQFNNDPVDSATPFDPKTFSLGLLSQFTQGLPQNDLQLLTTGATGLKNCQTDPTKPPFACAQPDTRIPNVASLTNTSFELSGPNLPYDSYTGDMVHRLFHMWQQSDCDAANATKTDPAGCKNDLYPYVGTARDDSGGNALGFYNVQEGHAPLFKWLADNFTIADNYHQADMGGTGVQHTMLGTADNIYWEPFGSLPAQPPGGQIADPTPKSATNVAFVSDKRWTKCGDPTAPGVKPIMDYLNSLPWRPDLTASNCDPDRYYMINNTRPGYLSNGSVDTAGITAGTSVPPSTLRTIGDALNEKNIGWAYFGGGYNAAVRFDNGSTNPIDVMIGTGGDWYCDICNPFQYATSIMGDPAQRKDHIKDVIDFFDDLDHGQLRAVSYVKPDSFEDGHPGYSKLDLFEGMIKKILDHLHAHPDLSADTAVVITFDEGGGYWDSGFFQPIDFFGDGPRIPLVVVSPFSRGGRVVHTYEDHASVVKFIERNWRLDPLTRRSRDNLPNPKANSGNPYVPVNMPAIGDLFDMFQFEDAHED
jgi:phospholipase C